MQQRNKLKKWISDSTLRHIERKHLAFVNWQKHHRNKLRQKEYRDLSKEVRRALRGDKEKWLESTMQDMDKNMKRNEQGDFFKKMKQLTNSKVTREGTILDESGTPLQGTEEKLAHWKRHFEGVLSVQGTVAEEAMASLEDLSHVDTPAVTRKEVERAVKRLRNGKAAGEDGIVPELLKNGGTSLVDYL